MPACFPNQDVSFDGADAERMSIAFDSVCGSLRNVTNAASMRANIAKQIIKANKAGEHDPQRLRDMTIEALGIEGCLKAKT